MIRFLPDTLRDALWRPIAMGAPDAGVYIETMAPDVRFACLLLLTVAVGVFALRRRLPRSPAWPLLAFTWLAFVPWLLTTGNGRYFIAVLLLAGPLCIALIYLLPLTRAFRLTLAVVILGLQGFALLQNTPWGSWGLTPWNEPYFQLNLTREDREEPATYVTTTSISYSLVAPQFDKRSHWINVASLQGEPDRFPDDRRAQDFLEKVSREPLPLKLLIPSVHSYMDKQRQPDAAIRQEINRLLGPHRLGVAASAQCRLLESRSIALLALRRLDNVKPEKLNEFGFWLCPLQFPVAKPAPQAPSPSSASALADRVFAKIEDACPRMFHRGEAVNVRLADGFSRTYPSADIKAYVMDSGDVFYKYWRGLNPGQLGKVEDVLADGFKMDCNAIPGRSGLPWERKL